MNDHRRRLTPTTTWTCGWNNATMELSAASKQRLLSMILAVMMMMMKDENLSWKHHFRCANKKLVSANFTLCRSKDFLQKRILQNINKSVWVSPPFWLNQLFGPQINSNGRNTTKESLSAHRGYNCHTLKIELEHLKVNDLISLNQAIVVLATVQMLRSQGF